MKAHRHQVSFMFLWATRRCGKKKNETENIRIHVDNDGGRGSRVIGLKSGRHTNVRKKGNGKKCEEGNRKRNRRNRRRRVIYQRHEIVFVTCLFVRRHLDSIVQPRRKKEKEEIVCFFLFASTKSEKWRNEIVLWVCLNERKRISFSPFDGKNFNFFLSVSSVRPCVCFLIHDETIAIFLSLFSYWLTLTMSCVNTHTLQKGGIRSNWMLRNVVIPPAKWTRPATKTQQNQNYYLSIIFIFFSF